MLHGKALHTNFIVVGIDSTIYHTLGKHANHYNNDYNNDAVIKIYKNILHLLLQNTIHTSSFVLNGVKNVCTAIYFEILYYVQVDIPNISIFLLINPLQHLCLILL